MEKKDYFIAAQSSEEFKRIEEAYNSFKEMIYLDKTGEYLFLIRSANDKKGVLIYPNFEDEEITDIRKKENKLECLIIEMKDGSSMVNIGDNNFYVMKNKGRMVNPVHLKYKNL